MNKNESTETFAGALNLDSEKMSNLACGVINALDIESRESDIIREIERLDISEREKIFIAYCLASSLRTLEAMKEGV